MQMVMHEEVGWSVEHWKVGWGAVDQWNAVNDEGCEETGGARGGGGRGTARKATWDVTVQSGKNCRSGVRLSLVNSFSFCFLPGFETLAKWLRNNNETSPVPVRLWLEKIKKASLPQTVSKTEGFFSFTSCFNIRSRILSKNRDGDSRTVSRYCFTVRSKSGSTSTLSWHEILGTSIT